MCSAFCDFAENSNRIMKIGNFALMRVKAVNKVGAYIQRITNQG